MLEVSRRGITSSEFGQLSVEMRQIHDKQHICKLYFKDYFSLDILGNLKPFRISGVHLFKK